MHKLETKLDVLISTLILSIVTGGFLGKISMFMHMGGG